MTRRALVKLDSHQFWNVWSGRHRRAWSRDIGGCLFYPERKRSSPSFGVRRVPPFWVPRHGVSMGTQQGVPSGALPTPPKPLILDCAILSGGLLLPFSRTTARVTISPSRAKAENFAPF